MVENKNVGKNCMVSIICNTYNQAKYIKDALNGFVMQETSFPFEVLIHDDASTDGTVEIIKEYEKKYPDIIKPIYEKENQYSKGKGLVGKIQKSRAKRKYVAMCEGDDYWTDPHKLQKQFDFMEANPDYTLCGCSTVWLNMLTGKARNKSRTEHDKDVSLEEFVMPTNGRPFPFVSFFLRTEIWKERPMWGFPVGDLPLTYYAALMGKVRMLADCMCVYRWHSEGSWTQRTQSYESQAKKSDKTFMAFDNIKTFAGAEYSELFERAKLWNRYAHALMVGDFRTIRKNPELYKIFKGRPLARKVSDVIRCAMPKQFMKLQMLLGRKTSF